MSRVSFAAAILSAAALFIAGCGGPTVESVCEDLNRDCGVLLGECKRDGDVVEELSEDEGCDSGFEEYLDCIDASGCDTRDACGDVRADLEACLGAPFPSDSQEE